MHNFLIFFTFAQIIYVHFVHFSPFLSSLLDVLYKKELY